MLQDIRFAVRTLLKNPAFTAAAVLCLALGIGVNTTVYSCVRALLLRPFPYRDPDALVAIGESNPRRGWHMNTVSYPNFRSWQAENRMLANVGIYTSAAFNLAAGDGSEFVLGGNVSWTMFPTLGVAPALGRNFTEEEDRVGSPKVVILGDQLWHDKFGGRADAIGQQIMVNGEKSTVVGVMPPDFDFPGTAKLWTPMQMDPNDNRGNHSWNVIGRLKSGATPQQAEQDLASIAARLSTQFPGSNLGWGVDVRTLREYYSGNLKPTLLLMMAAVAFVLLIACANVANLLLARATARSKEMAVRLALGADGWRLVRQLLTESVMVALAGAVLGIGVAFAFLGWVRSNWLGMPAWMHLSIDVQVLGFTLLVAVVTGLLFGVVPALHAARPSLNETLRDAGARGTSAGRSRQRLRSGLVISEVALSVVLLVGAALLIRSFMGLQRVAPGFDPNNLLTMSVTLKGPQYDSAYKRFPFWDRLLTNLNGRPGIVSAAIMNNIPLGNSNNNSFFHIEDHPTPVGQEPLLEIRWVSPKILETLRVPLLRGRMFTQQEWADSGVAGRVAVVNEYMAKKFWGTADGAIGKRFTFGNPSNPQARWNTIIGVAADVKFRYLNEDPKLEGYMPYRQGGWNSSAVVVRTMGDPTRATATVMNAMKEVDPMIPAFRVMSMDANIARSYWQQALFGRLFTAFATIALVLAAVGVYGVISYAVSQRTQEIGVRVALGAQRGDVMRLILGNGALLGGTGVLIGLGVALGVTRFMRTMLFGVSPFDPVSFVLVSAVLTAVALLASWLPARRASRVDPVEALRYE